MTKLLVGLWCAVWCAALAGLVLTYDAVPGWLHVLLALSLAALAPPFREVLQYFRAKK